MPQSSTQGRAKTSDMARDSADAITAAITAEETRHAGRADGNNREHQPHESISSDGLNEIDRAISRQRTYSLSFNREIMSDVEFYIELLANSPEIPDAQRLPLQTAVREIFERAKLGRLSPSVLVATATEEALPRLPEGLSWPTDTFSEANKAYGWDIVRYLDERWLPILEAGRERGRIFATRRILVARDPSAITAIGNFTRPHPKTGQRRQLPARLHFPILKEENNQALAGETAKLGDASRLARAAYRRGLRLTS
jgi:hypothetical protein